MASSSNSVLLGVNIDPYCGLESEGHALKIKQNMCIFLYRCCTGSRSPAISPTVPYQFKALLTFVDGFVLQLSPLRCRHRPKLWVGKCWTCFEVKTNLFCTEVTLNSALSMNYLVKIHAVQVKTLLFSWSK